MLVGFSYLFMTYAKNYITFLFNSGLLRFFDTINLTNYISVIFLLPPILADTSNFTKVISMDISESVLELRVSGN